MSRDERMIGLAIKISGLSTHRCQMAAVIARGNRVVSIGVNKNKSHPKQINPHTGNQGASIHAELDAILGKPEEVLKGADIYIGRRLKDGSWGLARPCNQCWAILASVGIRNVVYSVPDGFESEKL
jgi:deoxycytidylate deaminase